MHGLHLMARTRRKLCTPRAGPAQTSPQPEAVPPSSTAIPTHKHQVVPTGSPQSPNPKAEGHHLGSAGVLDGLRLLRKKLHHGHQTAGYQFGLLVNHILDNGIARQEPQASAAKPQASTSHFSMWALIFLT